MVNKLINIMNTRLATISRVLAEVRVSIPPVVLSGMQLVLCLAVQALVPATLFLAFRGYNFPDLLRVNDNGGIELAASSTPPVDKFCLDQYSYVIPANETTKQHTAIDVDKAMEKEGTNALYVALLNFGAIFFSAWIVITLLFLLLTRVANKHGRWTEKFRRLSLTWMSCYVLCEMFLLTMFEMLIVSSCPNPALPPFKNYHWMLFLPAIVCLSLTAFHLRPMFYEMNISVFNAEEGEACDGVKGGNDLHYMAEVVSLAKVEPSEEDDLVDVRVKLIPTVL